MELTKEQIEIEIGECYGIPTPFWDSVVKLRGQIDGLLAEDRVILHPGPIRDQVNTLFDQMSKELRTTQIKLRLAERQLTETQTKMDELISAQIENSDPDN